MHAVHSRRNLISAGIVLGIGMGGFFDGIVFHQLLQLHNMLSAKFPTRDADVETLVVNLEINMFWDGLFHIAMWSMTAMGLAMLWNAKTVREDAHATQALLGAMLLGWGLFNLVEGVINHHVLHLHHVVEIKNHLVYDLLFLGSGLMLSLVGWSLIHRARLPMPSSKRSS